MSNFLKAFQTMDEKNKKILKLIVVFFIVLLIAVILIGIFKNRKLTYSKIEEKMINAATKYYTEHEDLLPKAEGASVSLDSQTLVDNKYMKPLVKYNKKADSCSATVSVRKNGGLYLYVPTLKCADYETKNLYQEILKTQKIVEEESGLYEVDGEYIFRGEYPNNYVKFANKLWRIISLSNGEIRLIQVDSYLEKPWDNRYNVNAHYSSGITQYEISRMKDNLETIYNSDFDEREKSLLVSKQLCIGKRKKTEKDNSGKVECATLTEKSYPLGLLQVNEYVRVSLDKNCIYHSDSSCTNYNYMTKLTGEFWTLTISDENDYEAYYVSQPVSKYAASEFKPVRLVINIDGSIQYQSGDGTVEQPYVIS